MLLNLCKRNGDSELYPISIGQNIHGLRVYSVVLESPEEIKYLLSEKGQEWMKKTLLHIFRPNKQ